MAEEKKAETSSVRVGDLTECTVEQIMPYGAFMRLSTGQKGMVHISELSFNFVKKVEDILSLQQTVKARVIKIDEKGRIDLSLKKVEERPVIQVPVTKEDKDSFEKKMASFLKLSESKIADLNSKLNSSKSGRKKPGSKPKN
ncbi:MAG: S1 RNA-binding domain-containing protein [Synergistaceae bacterium]|jgi:S1 RNA binding domain protein|nr:S1 RNA-binding domain-containing protein [Synergistaceae bacterium]